MSSVLTRSTSSRTREAVSGLATADHRHRRVGYGRAGDDGGWAPQSPLGPSPDRHQVPRPGSVRKPPAATSRASVDTLGSYDSHTSADGRGAGHRRRARLRNRTRSSRARSASSAVRDSSVGEARRRESAVVCQQPPVVGSTQFGGRRRSRPRGRRDNRNRGKGIAGSRPSGRSLSGNAIVARVARLGAGAPLSLGESTSGAICSRPSLHEARTPGVCADAP